MKGDHSSLGTTEVEVLRYIADHHPVAVADVASYMANTYGQARTTILTTMERLRKKGFLTRRRIKEVFHYSPKVSKRALFSGLVKNFVNITLGGSVSPFVAYLSDKGSVSDEELRQLKQVVRDLERKQTGGRK